MYVLKKGVHEKIVRIARDSRKPEKIYRKVYRGKIGQTGIDVGIGLKIVTVLATRYFFLKKLSIIIFPSKTFKQSCFKDFNQ